MNNLTAQDAVNQFGNRLIGEKVLTQQIGDWPGGVAEVIELAPDPMAPEIVFNVQSEKHGVIGIFEYERVAVLI